MAAVYHPTMNLPGSDIHERSTQATRLFFSILRKLHFSQILDRVTDRLTPSQMGLLNALYESDEAALPVGRLAEELGVSPPAVSGLAERLQRDGYIVRQADPGDRRVVLLALTDAGKAAVEEFVMAFEKLLEPVLAQMSPEEQASLIAGMEHIRQLAERVAEGEPAVAPAQTSG
jgi:DNA-binding MarR family transcriptional regulator